MYILKSVQNQLYSKTLVLRTSIDVSEGGREWLGSKDRIGVTLKTSSEGGRQKIGSNVNFGTTL